MRRIAPQLFLGAAVRLANAPHATLSWQRKSSYKGINADWGYNKGPAFSMVSCIPSRTSVVSFLFNPALTATAMMSFLVGSMLSLTDVVRNPFIPSLGNRSYAGAKCQSPS